MIPTGAIPTNTCESCCIRRRAAADITNSDIGGGCAGWLPTAADTSKGGVGGNSASELRKYVLGLEFIGWLGMDSVALTGSHPRVASSSRMQGSQLP